MKSTWSPCGVHVESMCHLVLEKQKKNCNSWSPHGVHVELWSPRGVHESSMGQGKVHAHEPVQERKNCCCIESCSIS